MDDSFGLDGHKLMYHVKELYKWIAGESIPPIYVEVGPINACNHKCVFCGLDYVPKDGKALDKEILIKNLKDMADFGVKSVMFSGTGEPLLYKSIGKVMEKAKEFGLDVAITTNGVLFDKETMKSTLRYLSWIKLSIDAGKGDTYAKIHGTQKKHFEKIMKNLEFAVKFKKKEGLSCTIGAQMVLLKNNMGGVEDLAIKVKEKGADYLVLKPYSQHPDSINKQFLDIRKHSNKLIGLSRKHSDKNFQLIFRKATNEDIQKGELDYDRCYGLDFFALIDAHGNVIPCHTFQEHKEHYYGNICDSSFSDIWKSQKRKRIVKKLHKEGCTNCRKGCRMNFVNKYLFTLKRRNIGHINFI